MFNVNTSLFVPILISVLFILEKKTLSISMNTFLPKFLKNVYFNPLKCASIHLNHIEVIFIKKNNQRTKLHNNWGNMSYFNIRKRIIEKLKLNMKTRGISELRYFLCFFSLSQYLSIYLYKVKSKYERNLEHLKSIHTTIYKTDN